MPTTPVMSGLYEITPERLFGLFKRLDEHLPQVVPHVITNGLRVQGNGSAGTIDRFTLAPAISGGIVTTVTDTTEVYDEDTKTMVVDMQGDPRCSSLKLKVQLQPGPVAGTTKATSFGEYIPVGSAPGPTDLMALVPGMIAGLVTL